MKTIPPAVQGALLMLFSAVCYVASAAILRQLGDAYSAFELTFLRSIVAVVMLAPIFMRFGRLQLWPERPFAHFMAAVFSYLGILLWFVGAAQMPIADFFALNFTTPLFTIALAILLLRERSDLASWAATVIGFIGVLIVLRPGVIAVTFAALATLGSSASYAGVNTVIRSLSRTVSTAQIVFYTNLVMIPISMPMAIIEWKTPLVADLPAILGIAVLSTLGYVCVSKAIALAPANVVQPVNFMRMPIAAGFGFVLFNEFPDLWTWVGAAVIFCATTYAVQHGTRK